MGVAIAGWELEIGPHGKPELPGTSDLGKLDFNLSHSGDIALIGVSRCGSIGVDVERWERGADHLTLAQQFFSGVELEALRGLADRPDDVVAGFFAGWTRKEAYLKATGHGVTRGLRHFDVTLSPDAPAELLADRLDETARERWHMVALAPADGYSGAVVVARPVKEMRLFDWT